LTFPDFDLASKQEVWLNFADLIWYSAGENFGLSGMAFVGDEKFPEIYITLHYKTFTYSKTIRTTSKDS